MAEPQRVAAALRDVYDREVRGSFPHRLPTGWTAEQDGPLTRCLTARGGFAMLTDDPSPLTSVQLEALVGRTFAFYAERGRDFEWKTFDHDRADLRPLLAAYGARPEAHEALVLGDAGDVISDAALPLGLTLTTVTSRADLERVAALESQIWAADWSWLADDLAARLEGAVPAEVLLVEDGGIAISAAWLVPLAGTCVAGLWGGGTHPDYRRRGIYRALVARRARSALDRGYTTVQVDASDDSRPILQRLGLHVVGGTIPFVTTAASEAPVTRSAE
jgi:GNAT superfamily N-acetyltransferase